MDNCYAVLQGGLGNQLFQIATGYAYSRRYDKAFYIDDSKWTASQGRSPGSYRDTIFKNFNYKHAGSCYNIAEPDMKFHVLPFVEGDVAIHGYRQSIKYFEEYSIEFINLLELPEVDTWFMGVPNVVFHIRRGDYMRYPLHYVCTFDYFKKQFEEFKGFQINVCTDSPEHVCTEFKGFDFNLLKTTSELKDFTYMTKHQNIVCSNSSFSWWASLLGNMTRIIVPDRWFNDDQENDIYRKDMVKVKV